MRIIVILVSIMIAIIATSCSSANNSTTPDFSNVSQKDSSFTDLGNFVFEFNPVTEEINVEPVRSSSIHYEISNFLQPPYCGPEGCLTAQIVEWLPAESVLRINIGIQNGSPYTPSDVRLIFFDLGLKDILNPDAYTDALVKDISPFISYGLTEDNIFPPGQILYDTVNIYWPPLSSFRLESKVTAWLWLNCPDPYRVDAFQYGGPLTTTGGSINVGAEILDYQDDVELVILDTTPLTGGLTEIPHLALDIWETSITNSENAPVGVYTCLLSAFSPNPWNYTTYDYVDIPVIEKTWQNTGTWNHYQETCSYADIAVNSSTHETYVAKWYSGFVCNEVWTYPGYDNPMEYLIALDDLANPPDYNFQPYPFQRIDVSSDGGFGWTNNDSTTWRQLPWVTNAHTFTTIPGDLNFEFDPESNDHRHYMHELTDTPMTPVDVCDTFDGHLCTIYNDTFNSLIGFQAIGGTNQGQYYLDDDIKWSCFFPPEFIGTGPGRVANGGISGIDAYTMGDVLFLYISEAHESEIEVFTIEDIGPGTLDSISHEMSFDVKNIDDCPGYVKDIELLPANPEAPVSDKPMLCALIDAQYDTCIGSDAAEVWIYDAHFSYEYPYYEVVLGFFDMANALDTDDSDYNIHVRVSGTTVHLIEYI